MGVASCCSDAEGCSARLSVPVLGDSSVCEARAEERNEYLFISMNAMAARLSVGLQPAGCG